MKALKMASGILLLLGVLLLAGSLIVTIAVENNEDVALLESLLGSKITPKKVDSVLQSMDGFFDFYADDEIGGAITALKIYAMTPTLYMVGGIVAALGLIGLIVFSAVRKKPAAYTSTPPSTFDTNDIDWF